MQLDLEELISLQEDTHVNHSAKQVGDKAKKMNVISGQKCYELSKVANHDTFWLKMLLVMSQWASTKCLLTWKIKDTPQGRLLYQLVPKTHHIDETEFGSSDSLLPTPTTQEIEHPEVTLTKNNRRLSKDGKSSHSLNLADTMMLWPTPNAWDGKRGPRSQKNLIEKNHQITLITAVKDAQSPTPTKMWPTPNASPSITQTVKGTLGLRKRNRKQGQLMEAVVDRMFPTPRARDYKDGSSVPPSVLNGTRNPTLGQEIAKRKFWPTPAASDNRDRGNLSNPSVQRRIKLGKQVGLTMAVKEENTGGTLNSDWVTWLMGYPEGYLDISTENQNTSQELPKEKKTEPKS